MGYLFYTNNFEEMSRAAYHRMNRNDDDLFGIYYMKCTAMSIPLLVMVGFSIESLLLVNIFSYSFSWIFCKFSICFLLIFYTNE